MNYGLNNAKRAANDEFYTRYSDIEKEMPYWKDKIKNKIVYCFTDDINSNFWRYFFENFHFFSLKKLIASSKEGLLYSTSDGKSIIKEEIENGDFREERNIERMKIKDTICITNPPFSIIGECLKIMLENKINFLVLGPETAVSKKDIFPFFLEDKIGYGYTSTRYFSQPDGTIKRVGNCQWLSSFFRPFPPLKLTKNFNSSYLTADNYNAINVDRIKDIPSDYYGVMAVPITYLHHYCPSQFKILGITKKDLQGIPHLGEKKEYEVTVNGQKKFTRVFIQRRIEET